MWPEAMDGMPRRPVCYVLLLQTELAADGRRRWRGTLVTAANQRLHFATLAELGCLLSELAGWQDPADTAPAEPGESGPA